MRPLNPLWYTAALFLVLGGWMAGTAVAAGSWDTVREAELVPLEQRIDAADGSVAVFTDIRQPERDVTCRATPRARGSEPTPFGPAPLDLRVDRDGTTWYLVGWLAEGADGLKVTCTPRDRAADNATYATAAVEGVLERANTGQGIAWLATAAGAGLAIWTWVARRRHRRETAGVA